MPANAKGMPGMPNGIPMMGSATTLPDKLAMHEKMMATHLDDLRKLKAAVEPLYAAFNADQKKTADELQRRIVNDVVKQRSYGAVVLLCGAYVGAVFLQGSTKLGLNIYRSWVGECAKRDLRRRVCESTAAAGTAAPLPEAQGTAVAMI